MAYNRDNTARRNNEQPGFEKAAAFINVYVAKKDGTRSKLGKTGIPLRLSNAKERQLLEWLQADAGNIEKLKAKLILDFNVVDSEKPGDLDLE